MCCEVIIIARCFFFVINGNEVDIIFVEFICAIRPVMFLVGNVSIVYAMLKVGCHNNIITQKVTFTSALNRSMVNIWWSS